MANYWIGNDGVILEARQAAELDELVEADRVAVERARREAAELSPPIADELAELVVWYVGKVARLAAELEGLASRLDRRLR